MDVSAKAKYVRLSPRKARLVLDLVRGQKIKVALDKLELINKRASLPIKKLLQSALANAEHNFKLKPEDLIVKKISAEQGPVLKRWRARAFGRAAMIRKPTAYLLVVLTDGKEVKPDTDKDKKDKAESKAETAKPEAKDKKTTKAKVEKKKSDEKVKSKKVVNKDKKPSKYSKDNK